MIRRMKHRMVRKARIVAVLVAAFAGSLTGVSGANEPASTAFSYQGRLTDQGAPADGAYEFEFRLYDAQGGGNLVASVPGPYGIDVTNGYFTARLDFGPAAFSGVQLFLEIGVRPESDVSLPYTILNPRQELTATPYASVALNSPFLREGSGLFYEGRMALGSDAPPSGILDVVGPPQDATVVLPGNAISSAEMLDEPGVCSAFEEGSISFASGGTTLTTATIQCPSSGYVLAIGTTTVRSVAYNASGGKVGIESTATPSPTPPADAYQLLFSDDMPSILAYCPVTVHKVFPVTAGARTFYLRGWRGFGDNGPSSLEAGLTLLFIPSAYGNLAPAY